MKNGILKFPGTEIKFSLLKDSSNNWMQFWYAIIPEKAEHIADQITTIEQAESELLLNFYNDRRQVGFINTFARGSINMLQKFNIILFLSQVIWIFLILSG